jgi:hypothetical protein
MKKNKFFAFIAVIGSLFFAVPAYAEVTTETEIVTTETEIVTTTTAVESESAVPDFEDFNPFTPDGTGSLLDFATDESGKEFFTILTEDGNVFYLIIDKQRSSKNVYLLNNVTENDLISLADKKENLSKNSVTLQTAEPKKSDVKNSDKTSETEKTPKPAGKDNNLIYVCIFAVIVFIIFYYYKIILPKKQSAGMTEEDDYEDDFDGGNDGFDEDNSDF